MNLAVVGIYVLFGASSLALGQPEVAAWGNIRGIRVDGQLMKFETSLRIVESGWVDIRRTAKERQRSHYRREGDKQIITTRLDSLFFTTIVKEDSQGSAVIEVHLDSRADTAISGVFLGINLPGEDYSSATVQVIDPAEISLAETIPDGNSEYLRVAASGVRVVAGHREFEITSGEPSDIIIRQEAGPNPENVQVYLAIISGGVARGDSVHKGFEISVSGEVDRRPISVTLDTSQTGRPFDGLGGNFRIQNSEVDPPVIQYLLDSLRVAWSRVDMPWMLWHPDEAADPLEAARAGDMHPRVQAAMEMAQDLHQRGIPVLLAIWFPPEWAIVGQRVRRPIPGQPRGNALKPEKMEAIYASIADYIVFLKEHYGVDVEMFSFNESDLGIDVRQTAEEHRELIKGLGARFASRGLTTKLLLGDTADANGWAFIEPAMSDSMALPYIGAVSFHSWRGWSDTTFAKWDAAARKLGVPLIVGEGSIDAGAWRYPDIFKEPTYALEEITLYTRILAECQPLSILQWQLTADYSVLSGGGVFGNDDEPLLPTQRYWNLKQLGATPEGLYAMPIACEGPDVTCAALGDNERGVYAMHLVNNGATREIRVRGLPDDVSRVRLFVTDSERGMEEGRPFEVKKGQARFVLETTSFTTLLASANDR